MYSNQLYARQSKKWFLDLQRHSEAGDSVAERGKVSERAPLGSFFGPRIPSSWSSSFSSLSWTQSLSLSLSLSLSSSHWIWSFSPSCASRWGGHFLCWLQQHPSRYPTLGVWICGWEGFVVVPAVEEALQTSPSLRMNVSVLFPDRTRKLNGEKLLSGGRINRFH